MTHRSPCPPPPPLRPTPTNDRQRVRRRRRRFPSAVACCLAAATLSSDYRPLCPRASAFVAVPAAAPPSLRRWSVVTYFRNEDDDDHHHHHHQSPSLDALSAAAAPPPAGSRMPAWLSIEKSHLSGTNVRSLADQMRSSHLFTESETRQILEALHDASRGDDQILAGASEFVTILVHMELGTAALVAAAFHYAACVAARREAANGTWLTSLDVPWRDFQPYGPHAAAIARDAARLKNLESVAAQVAPGASSSRSSGEQVARPNGRDAENLRRLLLSESSDWRGLAIRCAASLYRLRGLQEHAASSGNASFGGCLRRPPLSPETIRVAREALLIYAPLASRLGMRWLKNELENAAFQLLYRRQHEKVQSYEPLIRSMGQSLEDTRAELSELLARDDEFVRNVRDFTVTARVKEPYSLWNKMLRRHHHHVREVPDALALRIVLNARKLDSDEPDEVTRARERALCYYAQALCVRRWKPSGADPRFKDYIERPKPNGYQSLHYTAQNDADSDNGWALEFQVRTGQMHQIAEFGLASHWDYKAQQKRPAPASTSSQVPLSEPLSSASSSSTSSSSSSSTAAPEQDHSSDAYLRKVQEWHWQQRGHAHQPVLAGESYHPTSSSVTMSDVWQSKRRQDRIRDRAQRLEPYLTALTEAQSDLNRDYVFVFLTSEEGDVAADGVASSSTQQPHPGRVLALPSGACVLDALREGERAVGRPLVFARQDPSVNGIASPVTRQLRNGDVLSLRSPPFPPHPQHPHLARASA